jgi:hypothetical protein
MGVSSATVPSKHRLRSEAAMRYALYILQILVLMLITGPVPAHAEKRVALLVGINDYENIPKLQKAPWAQREDWGA